MANFTPQEIEEMLQEFFDVVGKRQYIGARYVPIFGRRNEDTVEWDNLAPYEPLSVVLHEGVSYVSKQYVPKDVEITDTNYWVETYRFNAQVEQYRQEVLTFQEQINDIRNDMEDDYVPFPDPDHYPKYGTDGQVLTTLANGLTKWDNPVVVDATIAEPLIDDWLDNHPEATTTVLDGSITTAKLHDEAVTKQKLSKDVNSFIDNLSVDLNFLNTVKNNKNLKKGTSVGTVQSGMVSITGAIFANASHIELSVNAGDTYIANVYGWNSNFPGIRMLDANDNIIHTAYTDDAFHRNVSIVIPSGASTLYIVGRTIGSGMECTLNTMNVTPWVLESTNDTTDRTQEVRSLLQTFGHVRLGIGTFYMKALDMPLNTTLEGSGEQTIIKYSDNETNASCIIQRTDALLTNKSIVTVKNLRFEGGLTSRPSTYSGRYTRNAITNMARNTLLVMDNVHVSGFSGDGVHVEYVGLEEGYSIQMSDCLIEFCGCGINFDAKAEYGIIADTIIRFNFVGCNNYGGNNKFVECGFENNVTGFKMVRGTSFDNNNVSYLNNGHSVACGCSFNHNQYPIEVGPYFNGYAFVGCAIYGGTITMPGEAKGIMFANCMIGTNTGISITENTLTRFTNCIFSDVPQSVSLPETHTLIMFDNCYELETGTQVTY